MNVAHVVSANKFTGAAAVAELNCRALRSVGVEARLIFRSGRNLETRLAEIQWAYPSLVKERSPGQIRSTLACLADVARWADKVICYLPHDHFLCWLAGIADKTALVRSVRHQKHANSVMLRFLARRGTRALVFAHQEMPNTTSLPSIAVPVPIESRFFETADPARWRRRLEIPDSAELIGAVGKLAQGRGFELFIECLSRLPRDVYGVIVGIGELQPRLEALAERCGVHKRLRFAGYQEEELPALFGAIDIVLVTAMGSDHGHRVISEAQASATPVVAVAFDGAADLIKNTYDGVLCNAFSESLADAIRSLFEDRGRMSRIGENAQKSASKRRFEMLGNGLRSFLDEI